MSNYFGNKPQDWERAMMRSSRDGSPQGEEMQRALANPEEYTTARPNMATEAAFSVGSMKGAGRDGLTKGPSTAYYKVEKPTESTPTPEFTPEAKPKPEAAAPTPIELSPEVAQAKERVNSYKNSIDGTAGSVFDSDNVDYNSLNEEQAPTEDAASSFLDAKKSKLMKEIDFSDY